MRLLAAIALVVAITPAVAPAQDTPTKELSPRVQTVEAYIAAKHAGDWDKVRSLLATDARIWFDKKVGDGAPLKAKGGPWSEWDRYFNSRSTHEGDYDEDDATVSVVSRETNDYYRLLDRPGSHYRATYFFTGNNKIEGILIEGIDDGNADSQGKSAEFEEWARKRHPAQLKRLMPEGRIVPSEENARLWRELLVEWRSSAGLPPIE